MADIFTGSPAPTPTPTPQPSPTPTPTPTPPVPSGCSAAGIGVTVCAPAAGLITGTPVQVTAAAKSSVARITVMRIYVDNVSKYTVNTSSIRTSLAISKGTHHLVMQAWDATGAVFKKSETITVQ